REEHRREEDGGDGGGGERDESHAVVFDALARESLVSPADASDAALRRQRRISRPPESPARDRGKRSPPVECPLPTLARGRVRVRSRRNVGDGATDAEATPPPSSSST